MQSTRFPILLVTGWDIVMRLEYVFPVHFMVLTHDGMFSFCHGHDDGRVMAQTESIGDTIYSNRNLLITKRAKLIVRKY
jgi:hypothetical protein